MNRNIDEAVKNIDYKRIMDKVCSKYNRYVDEDDMSSIRLHTLWQCLNKFDPERKVKFTTFLYQQLTFAIKNHLKRQRREYTNIPFAVAQRGGLDVDVALLDMPREMSDLLEQKYVSKMTMSEIGEANGYSRETARRRLKKAVDYYKS